MGARPVSSLDQVLQIIVFLQLLVSDIRPPTLPTSLVLPVLLLLVCLTAHLVTVGRSPIFRFLLKVSVLLRPNLPIGALPPERVRCIFMRSFERPNLPIGALPPTRLHYIFMRSFQRPNLPIGELPQVGLHSVFLRDRGIAKFSDGLGCGRGIEIQRLSRVLHAFL